MSIGPHLAPPASTTDCPVIRCGMHYRAAAWLDVGDVATLKDWMPAIEYARVKTWRGCTCQLYERIKAAVA
jgi:hypothetical protein